MILVDQLRISTQVAGSAGRTGLSFLTAALLAALSGCAHHGAIIYGGGLEPAVGAQHRGGRGAAGLAGTWEWTLRANDPGGNVRVEQEEWHLEQQGRELSGYYDRAVTILSNDDRLFQCNQKLGYTRFTRVRVAGDLDVHGRLHLRELSYRTMSDPCDDGARILVSYDGELTDGTLRLSFANHQGFQSLHRRDGDSNVPGLAELVGFEDARRRLPPEVRSTLPVSGEWQWELRSVDGEGDDRFEREDWNLREVHGEISGYYRRRVVRQRGEGVFSCNGRPSFEITTRYGIRGHRHGDAVTLTETGFQSSQDPCDNGLRRLDVYQGSVAKGGNELVLTWGSGNQVLRRKAETTGN